MLSRGLRNLARVSKSATPFSHGGRTKRFDLSKKGTRFSHGEKLSAELTDEGVAPLSLGIRSPHPAASAATFSLWEKDDMCCRTRKLHQRFQGSNGESDGTRTRDLRRDRPAL